MATYTNPYSRPVIFCPNPGAYYDVGANATISYPELGSPYAVGVLSATAGINYANGALQSATMPAANVTAFPIAGGGAGATLELHLTGAAADRTWTTALGLPSDSLLALPKTITLGKLYVLRFKYLGSAWKLVSVVGGF